MAWFGLGERPSAATPPAASSRAGPRSAAPRYVLGVFIGDACRAVEVALLPTQGRGYDARLEPAIHGRRLIPPAVADLYRRVVKGPIQGSHLPLLATELAQVAAVAVMELLAEQGLSAEQTLAIGLHDPGLWTSADDGPRLFTGLCDPARLAEATGVTVVDELPARDLSKGGRGGPILALGRWLLLAERKLWKPRTARALIDLGETTRVMWLPGRVVGAEPPAIVASDVAPGLRLLVPLAEQIRAGEDAESGGGSFAVQGRVAAELLADWQALLPALPPWQPEGVPADAWLARGTERALAQKLPVRDLLCTATHLIASAAAAAVKQLPGSPKLAEVILAGAGRHNGFLLRELATLLAPLTLTPLPEDSPANDALDAAAAAVMALLHIDQAPGSLPSLTGVAVPRLLGRLTPGAPANWHRVLAEMADHRPEVMALRNAV